MCPSASGPVIVTLSGEREKTSAPGSSPAAYSHSTCEDTWCRTICSESGRPSTGESGTRGIPDAGRKQGPVLPDN
jgi:hypothetical protein